MRPLLVLFLAFGLQALATPGQAALKPRALVRLANLAGKPVGTADFRAMRRGVLIEFNLEGLSPGPHGIHIHTSGNCSAKTGFTSAGPIWNPAPGKSHGYLNDNGPLAGDLPNQFAGADGRLHASVLVSAFNLGNGKKSLFDRDGAALIVDQRGDDYRTAPLGNAGDRIACGVIVRAVGPAARRRPPGKARAR
jgi:Cu-Zn family superoxide dismutase